ncbi:TIGR00730 family Rossman fold protein [Aquihabitans sp. McL0605]|uniref:LOG family protein n=1 Tax=Aquihabitans sp. McL0605 TaxID=3415671 RepID=UPI003CF023A8
MTDPSSSAKDLAQPIGPHTPADEPAAHTHTDDPTVDDRIRSLLAGAGVTTDVDQIFDILATGVHLGQDHTDRLDLKITASAIEEMRHAFRMFAPYKDQPKVTIFGSARTASTDPVYRQTHDVASSLAAAGWMVVTGAGPGIMLAAMEGAGPAKSIGVSIRLPFETRANDVIHDDPKHVSMKYFFTRKLMLVKESKGFIAVPGGFGTLDETLELLTLQQTGKAEPTPIVLLDAPGGTFWEGFASFIDHEVVTRGLVADDDLERVLITDSCDAAVTEILGFWRNYHSLRWVGKRLIVRVRSAPSTSEIEQLNDQFSPCLLEGAITATAPLSAEVSGRDHLDLPRLAMVWNPFQVGELHRLVRALNSLPSAPPA